MQDLFNIYPSLNKQRHNIYFYTDFSNKIGPGLKDELEELLRMYEYVFLIEEEVLQVDYIQPLHQIAKHFPPDRIFIFAVSLEPEIINKYYAYCEELNVRPIPVTLFSGVDHYVGKHRYPRIPTGPRKHKFLSLNRLPRIHRIMLLQELQDHDLLEHGKVSFGFDPLTPDIAIDQLPTALKEFVYENKDNWPLLLDKDDLVDSSPIGVTDDSLYPLFEDSYFSIVTETYFFNGMPHDPDHHWENDWTAPSALAPFIFKGDMSITEKTFKAIFHKHPFVMLGPPNLLNKLRDFGYKTFSPWIDETYDTVRDHEARLTIAISEIERLTQLSTDEWDTMIQEMTEILQHNYKLYITKPYDRRITHEIENYI